MYEGLFKDGLMHGFGVLIKKDKCKIKGVWKDDQLSQMIVYENLSAIKLYGIEEFN